MEQTPEHVFQARAGGAGSSWSGPGGPSPPRDGGLAGPGRAWGWSLFPAGHVQPCTGQDRSPQWAVTRVAGPAGAEARRQGRDPVSEGLAAGFLSPRVGANPGISDLVVVGIFSWEGKTAL